MSARSSSSRNQGGSGSRSDNSRKPSKAPSRSQSVSDYGSNTDRSDSDNPWVCKHCDQSFSKLSKLDAHVAKRHGNELPYVCKTLGVDKECGFKTNERDTFIDHANRRHGLKLDIDKVFPGKMKNAVDKNEIKAAVRAKKERKEKGGQETKK
jgi:uncharacterized C2H2 Zn-finger protein